MDGIEQLPIELTKEEAAELSKLVNGFFNNNNPSVKIMFSTVLVVNFLDSLTVPK